MDKSFARRLPLNSAIFKSPYWVLPVDDVGHENYIPVGRGVQSSTSCGRYRGIRTCENLEAHKGKLLGLRDATNMVVVKHMHWFCNRALCPVCFIRGYSVRRAKTMTSRLEEGVRRGLGDIEHILVSVSPSDYDLQEDVLRPKCRAFLKSLGVSGFSMVFHGYRVDRKRQVLVWRPHYHAYGYVEGGYICRGCKFKSSCKAECDGFDSMAWKAYQKDNYFVKVFSERRMSYYDIEKRNIFGSVFYALNHATKRIGIRRSHIVTWNGTVSNRQFKTPKVITDVKCPVCKESMRKSKYEGCRPFIEDVGHPDYEPYSLRPKFKLDGSYNFSHLDV